MPEPPQKKSAPSTSPVTPTAAPPSRSGPTVSTPPPAPAPAPTISTTTTEVLPPETAPTPPALDAADPVAVRTWVAAHIPEPKSLLYYALLGGVGALGLVEWPTVAVGALAQLVIDRRFAGVENLAAELRARLAGRPVPADTP